VVKEQIPVLPFLFGGEVDNRVTGFCREKGTDAAHHVGQEEIQPIEAAKTSRRPGVERQARGRGFDFLSH
jgi:hypothetical protein